jgi:hypothetical protein
VLHRKSDLLALYFLHCEELAIGEFPLLFILRVFVRDGISKHNARARVPTRANTNAFQLQRNQTYLELCLELDDFLMPLKGSLALPFCFARFLQCRIEVRRGCNHRGDFCRCRAECRGTVVGRARIAPCSFTLLCRFPLPTAQIIQMLDNTTRALSTGFPPFE